jgi:hypothetical protein
MFLNFVITLALAMGFGGWTIGQLVVLLIPAYPALLPRLWARLRADAEPPKSIAIPARVYRIGTGVGTTLVLLLTQLALAVCVFSPHIASELGAVRLVGVAAVELILLAWTAYVIRIFQGARSQAD